ncbi:hypothetical protein ACHAXA_002882 [Cyclostephanos tholiformis]|uniref:Steroid 5-alpha reductase C-terminal domain-containing protein n=1 Tax=Cyclostephanos tholiformis TaxID=382380 RepID=A0ABD3SGI9_9STRA
MVGRIPRHATTTRTTSHLISLILLLLLLLPSASATTVDAVPSSPSPLYSSSSSSFVGPPPRLRADIGIRRHHRAVGNGGSDNNDVIPRVIPRGGGGVIIDDDDDSIVTSSSLTSASSPIALPMTAAVAPLLRTTLSTGTPPMAVLALYCVSAMTVLPLTWYRTGYSFSVGYGLSVSTMSLALLHAFATTTTTSASRRTSILAVPNSPPAIVAYVSLLYGLRLAAYVYVRERTVRSKREQFDSLDKTSPIRRTPLALTVSFLYALMVSPAMFALRDVTMVGGGGDMGTMGTGGWRRRWWTQVIFASLAAFGMATRRRGSAGGSAGGGKKEATMICGRKAKDDDEMREVEFVGPTDWSYSICRHPNYLGEMLHWIGLFGVGCVSFGTSITAWSCGILGLWGILGIMFGASSRLDGKQDEMYGGMPNYEEWKSRVRWSVIPFIK